MSITNYNTQRLNSREQFSYWNDAVCQTFTALNCQRPDKHSPSNQAYNASLENWELEGLQISRVNADPSLVDHSQQLVAKSTQSVRLLHMQISGSSSNTQGGREAILQPGDFTICDSGQPYTLRFDQAIDMMVLKIPDSLFQKHFTNNNQLYAQRFSANDGIGLSGVVSDYLKNIWNNRQQKLTPLQNKSIADCALSLLSSHLNSYQTLGSAVGESSSQGLLVGMKRYIQQCICEPSLCPESVAQASHISPRYLRRLFSDDGLSCSKYIAKQRLEMAAKMLREPQLRHLKIIDIAFRCGFQDSSHFSRRFTEHFGISAKAYRQR
jgi:AraC-like DNA-binding protein